MFKPITKWRWSIRNADSIPEIVRRAFKISIDEKGGAVHIELPEDVAKMKSAIKPIIKAKNRRIQPQQRSDKTCGKDNF